MPESGLRVHVNVAELGRATASSIAYSVKQNGSASLLVENSAVFRGDTGRNRLEAESWARVINLAVNQTGSKAAVTYFFAGSSTMNITPESRIRG